MQLKINYLYIFLLIFLFSCKNIDEINNNKFEFNNVKKSVKNKIETLSKENENQQTINKNNNYLPLYIVGDSYFIEGIEHFPQEDYSYNKIGLATFYDKELHKTKTLNNEYNNVTELLARHKTLPLPSLVKITNLENGLSLVVRINDRSENNLAIIEVSRKVAQLLRFYKEPKLAKVRVEILVDESKQLKIVNQSFSDPNFEATLEAVPTENVLISDLNETDEIENNLNNNFENPVELIQEEIEDNTNIYINVFNLLTYNDTQNIREMIEKKFKITTSEENGKFQIQLGPMSKKEANNLFQILVSKGYKNSEILFK
ncbi:MAG: Rare lipoprotein A [Alphaproteobacteria bacterium MarineAlpha5_Bin9]|nr:MAG: Rare lipoprotein A [Alphaproteobacteria bacterium MarineAlpha5_Bin9]|tara:strand:+ start:1552 stop:2499 length:948 start_codon:yes stop_codon:yes gene_type:complete